MLNRLNSNIYNLKRSEIRVYANLARSIPGCISLTLGEPDFDTPVEIKEACKASLDANETHYIPNNGLPALCEEIAAFEREKHGLDYAADEVIVTVGATEAIYVALYAILNPGEEVIVPTPAFPLYAQNILMCGGKPVFLDTSAQHFQIREKELRACVSDKTKAIVLNSPNNPTGCILDEESLEAVYHVAREKELFVLCDDVYNQLLYTKEYRSFAQYADLKDRILLIQSFSKPYAMTGWRMGYLMVDRAIKERMELAHQFMVTSASSISQKACITALSYDNKEMVQVYEKRRDYVLQRLAEMGLSVVKPEGAFYVFPSIENLPMTSDTFARRLMEEEKLAITPGICFGNDHYIRISYCYSDEVLKEGMDRLAHFVERIGDAR